jgi:ornithine cyclodeaminase/alanine dehydrogenase-like protein (mu-crystallin family)
MHVQPSPADCLTVAVLGTGRMAGIHLAALANLRDRGLQVDGRTVRVEPTV